MLTLLYLFIALLVGNTICRRLFVFTSAPHRIAANFLIGILACTIVSYLLALAFSGTDHPMAFGNIAFFVLAMLYLRWNCWSGEPIGQQLREYFADEHTTASDWIWASVYLVISAWLMFGTLAVSETDLNVAAFLWNDFGPNLSLVQSFAVGRNFPAEYPHFIGEPIRYHFLFWFQAGNLEYLGLNIAWALNLLSTLTMAAMLVLISAFGRTIFGSRPVGVIAALLFFAPGTLSYIPFLASKAGPSEMLRSIWNVSEWIPSIYSYSGEQWGVWSMGTFLAQRHLLGAIGIFLVVLVQFLQTFSKSADSDNDRDRKDLRAYVFYGLILGLLPLWNGAVFVAAIAGLGACLLLFEFRRQLTALLVTAILLAIPQILSLRSAGNRGLAELFRWGYVVDPPTIANVVQYFAFTFGLKFALACVALIFLNRFQRKFFLAISSLLALAFVTQLSTDVMNNHKLINVWMILMNAYVAFLIPLIWRQNIVGKVAATILLGAISLGGLIELIRVWNVKDVDIPYDNGAYYTWLKTQAVPTDIFLSDRYVHSPILLSGRRVFYGWQYFGWSMGYPTGERDALYKKLYTETDVNRLVDLLHENNITYVAFDEGLRNSYLKGTLNETVVDQYFERSFSDPENRYHSLVIYKVPPK